MTSSNKGKSVLLLLLLRPNASLVMSNLEVDVLDELRPDMTFAVDWPLKN